MLKISFVVLLCVSMSLAVQFLPITNNTVVKGVLPQPIIDTKAAFLGLHYYRVMVPQNARQVIVTFNNTNSDNCYLHRYISNTIPCVPDLLADGNNYVCDDAYDWDYSSSYLQETFNSNTNDNYIWQVGSYMYIAVGRVYQDNYTCTYDLTVEVDVCASPTDVGIYIDNLVGSVCIPSHTAPPGITIPVIGLNSTEAFVGVVSVPNNTYALRGQLNATSGSLALYGRSWGAPSIDNYDCFVDTADTIAPGVYQYNLLCEYPLSGNFYFWLFDDTTGAETYNVSLSLSIQTCKTGFGGFNCSSVSTMYNATADNGKNFIVPANDYRYWYIDFLPNTETSLAIMAVSNTSSFTYIWERLGGYFYSQQNSNGYGYENSNQYQDTPNPFYIVPGDLVAGGRLYFGVENDNDTPVSITLTLNSTTIVPTTPPTTAGTPTVATASDHTSAKHSFALMVLPSALLVTIFAWIASLF